MLFKDKETFINCAQIIPGIIIVTWIIMTGYLAYVAPRYPDEANGRVYAVNYKSETVYFTLTEEILICGSAILAPVSMLALNLISLHYWKDNED